MKIIEKMNNQFKTILSIIFITVGLTARANGWTELGGFVMTGLVILFVFFIVGNVGIAFLIRWILNYKTKEKRADFRVIFLCTLLISFGLLLILFNS
jgi:hypothetical protein